MTSVSVEAETLGRTRTESVPSIACVNEVFTRREEGTSAPDEVEVESVRVASEGEATDTREEEVGRPDISIVEVEEDADRTDEEYRDATDDEKDTESEKREEDDNTEAEPKAADEEEEAKAEEEEAKAADCSLPSSARMR